MSGSKTIPNDEAVLMPSKPKLRLLRQRGDGLVPTSAPKEDPAGHSSEPEVDGQKSASSSAIPSPSGPSRPGRLLRVKVPEDSSNPSKPSKPESSKELPKLDENLTRRRALQRLRKVRKNKKAKDVEREEQHKQELEKLQKQRENKLPEIKAYRKDLAQKAAQRYKIEKDHAIRAEAERLEAEKALRAKRDQYKTPKLIHEVKIKAKTKPASSENELSEDIASSAHATFASSAPATEHEQKASMPKGPAFAALCIKVEDTKVSEVSCCASDGEDASTAAPTDRDQRLNESTQGISQEPQVEEEKTQAEINATKAVAAVDNEKIEALDLLRQSAVAAEAEAEEEATKVEVVAPAADAEEDATKVDGTEASAEEEAAALKIQSIHRGKQSRKGVEAMRRAKVKVQAVGRMGGLRRSTTRKSLDDGEEAVEVAAGDATAE